VLVRNIQTGSRRLRVMVPAVVAAIFCLVAPTGAAAAGPSAGDPSADGPPGVAAVWDACPTAVLTQVPAASRGRYRCATYDVPVDYRHPAAGTIGLAMLRRAADDPANRIGSLFINPGGPGGSGLLMPAWLDGLLPAEITSRFDLVGFDPRGVGASAPLRCFTNQTQAADLFSRIVGVPVTSEEIASTLTANRDYADACAANAGPLLQHMSTQDVARDLDRMRQAVGDRQLNYLGYSYGTMLGATYVNLFPQRAAPSSSTATSTQSCVPGRPRYLRQRAAARKPSSTTSWPCAPVGDRCALTAGGDPA
jgi:pimeloyl-ACP methyl ester carboxylesterase